MNGFADFILFLSGGARVNKRFGVIDIGSNSVRLVVFDMSTRTPAIFFNEKVFCGLGAALEDTGRLALEGREKAEEALGRFKALASNLRVAELMAVATAAVREAEDGPEFAKALERDLGVKVMIASGADEARLAAQGVLLGDPAASGVVADMGGASMELSRVSPDGIDEEGVTTPLGPLRLQALGAASRDKLIKRVDATLKDALEPRFMKPKALYALGGSWRTVARCYMTRADYPLHILHGYEMTLEEALEASDWVSGLAPEKIRVLGDANEKRAEATPIAALTLNRLLSAIKPRKLVLSACGLREGVVWERMDAQMRARDPLIDGCEALEAANARMPGFASELWAWLEEALGPISANERRLSQAVCLLADANWRTHPDYRSRASFELITRSNLGGVDHGDRLFMAAALIHRYKGARKTIEAEPAMELLPADRLKRAEALGRGARLGVMLSGAAPGFLPRCRLIREGSGGQAELVLRLPHDAAALMGEEVGKRLDAFAAALGLPRRLELGR